MGGKASTPPAPNYTPIAQADQQTAQMQLQLGQQQLKQSQDNFNTTWPYAQQYLQQQITSSQAATQNAENQQAYYDKTYKPIESQFAQTASNYNTPDRANQNAGQAMGDVASAFDQSRTTALSNLESYGIDPSQTRYSALDLGTRISQAAATAGADTQSRIQTEGTGLALQGQAINVGRGYPSAVNNSYNTATGAGSAGLTAANQTASTGMAGMSGASNTMNNSTYANSGAIGALNTGYQNNLAGAQFGANQSAQFSQGMGSLIGGAAGAAMMFM